MWRFPHRSSPARSGLLAAALTLAIPALSAIAADAVPAARPAPLPRNLGGDPALQSYAGQTLPRDELEARLAWLAFAQMDDARDALAAGDPEHARGLAQRALDSLERLRDPHPVVRSQLASAVSALGARDVQGGARALGEAAQRFRGDLMTFEARVDPITTNGRPPRGGGGSSSYSNYGGGSTGTGGGVGGGLSPSAGPPGFGAPLMSSGPNSTAGAYGFGSTGPSSAGSALSGYGNSYGGAPTGR